MTSKAIIPRLSRLKAHLRAKHTPGRPPWPRFVAESPVARRYGQLLGDMNWAQFPERDLATDWGRPAVPYAAFAAACLVKLDVGLVYMSQLRRYLVEHPALRWVLGFPLAEHGVFPARFKPEATLPTARHFTRLLRRMPNNSLQYLLDESVRLLREELREVAPGFGEAISLDTKHIIAWVKENNPKAYVSDRYDKTKQPGGDPDCRLGCKRRHNQRTPTQEGRPASSVSVGEFYWGYASGVVATKVPGWGEFVLAELTQPFDCSDVSYFFPLMADTERRLGFRPRFGAFDAAFDAFYVYEHFHRADSADEIGFAAVPLALRGQKRREFDADGLPLCAAGLAMPLKYTFINRTSFIEHERGHHSCPLHDQPDAVCPVDHKRWAKGGCTTRLATSIGARIRHQLDRESARYKTAYQQRTATERINAQAVALGIERPRLRNGQAIANLNTLIYVLINLRALQRVRRKKEAEAA